MRRLLIAGNWKMHKTFQETEAFAADLLSRLSADFANRPDILICPGYPLLAAAHKVFSGSAVSWGAQNCHAETSGAFTGEVSVEMLKSLECSYVIIGHSERRAMFAETNQSCSSKIKAAMGGGLKPIYCVGETLEERRNNQTNDVLQRQIAEGLDGVVPGVDGKLTIAYEPVWAIGTGLAATSEMAEEAHAFIRSQLRDKHGEEAAEAIRILYGGSMKPGNAADLLKRPNVDGGLIGGASLDAESFAAIISHAEALADN